MTVTAECVTAFLLVREIFPVEYFFQSDIRLNVVVIEEIDRRQTLILKQITKTGDSTEFRSTEHHFQSIRSARVDADHPLNPSADAGVAIRLPQKPVDETG